MSHEQYYEFEAEYDRLQEEVDEITESMASISPENPAFAELRRTDHGLATQQDGLEWALESNPDDGSGWDADGVTLCGLTGGQEAEAIDTLQSSGGGEKARRNYYVAAGTVEAPYTKRLDDMDGAPDWANASVEERLVVVTDLPPAYLEWADARIEDLTSVGSGNVTDFLRSYRDKRQQSQTDS